MRRFRFQKPLVESAYPPESKNVLWVDINEATGSLTSIKEYNNGKWEEIIGEVREAGEEVTGIDLNPNFPKPNEIYVKYVGDEIQNIDVYPNGDNPYDYPQIINIESYHHPKWGYVHKVVFDKPLPEEFPWYMFSSEAMLEKIWLPKHTKYIPYASFYNCSSLCHIYMPEGVVGIGEKAFLGIQTGNVNSDSNTDACNFPSTLRYLGNNSFALTELYYVKFAKYLEFGHNFAFKDSSVQGISIKGIQLEYNGDTFQGTALNLRSGYAGDVLWYNFNNVYSDETECLLPGTQILVNIDGTTKSVEDLVVGDTVIVYDGKEYIAAELDKVIDVKHTFYLDINFVDGTKVSISPDHAILTEEGWKSYKPYMTEIPKNVGRLTIRDKVFVNGEYVNIKNIILYSKPDTVMYNIGVKGYNNYIANGVCVYECSGSN